jgi:hypothetical protein
VRVISKLSLSVEANRTNGIFVFPTYEATLNKPKEPFFPSLDKKLGRNKQHLKNYFIFVKK